MTQEAFICDAVRTPIGRYAGALATVRTDDLAAAPISALMAKHPRLDWERLDDVILARMAALLAGLPVEVGGATVNRLCGSGLEAIAAAIRAIRAGDGEFYIAGGVESMSRSPFVLPKAEEGFSRQAEIADTTIGWRLVNPKMKDEYGVDPLLRSLGLPEDGEHINPNGGAIALGHPLGMSGARLVLTATRELERRKSKRALCTMCVGVGQGISAIIERV
jgi:acetyl-CoA acetyltransferase